MRSSTEITLEISALKALTPVGSWAVKTKQLIDISIEALQDGLDMTTDEFLEMTPGQQEHAQMALEWKTGESDEKPSSNWGGLVAKT